MEPLRKARCGGILLRPGGDVKENSRQDGLVRKRGSLRIAGHQRKRAKLFCLAPEFKDWAILTSVSWAFFLSPRHTGKKVAVPVVASPAAKNSLQKLALGRTHKRSCKKMPRAYKARGIKLSHSGLRNRGASCASNRARAAALIWLTRLSSTPSRMPICFMVHSSTS